MQLRGGRRELPKETSSRLPNGFAHVSMAFMPGNHRMKSKRVAEAGALTSMAVGKASIELFEPESVAALLELLRLLQDDGKKIFVVGAGSNSVIRDSVPEDNVCISTRSLKGRTQLDGGRFQFLAGEMLPSLVIYLRNRGYSGMEFLITVPGTVGGAIVMNAGEGTLGRSISRMVESVTVWTKGEIRHYTNEECGFAYRRSAFQEDGVVVLSTTMKFELATISDIDRNIAHRKAFAAWYYDTSAPNAGTIYLRHEDAGSPGTGGLLTWSSSRPNWLLNRSGGVVSFSEFQKVLPSQEGLELQILPRMGDASRKTIYASYWRDDKLLVNLGDYVTELLITAMGYNYAPYRDGDRSLVWIIGSLFESHWFDRHPRPDKIIWGCGHSGDERFDHSRASSECDVRAVRGYLTREKMGLPRSTPVGDPALLLPRFLPINRMDSGEVLYVPHFMSRDNLHATTLSSTGADRFLDIACPRQQFVSRVEELAKTGFVLTSSLHAAIIAQAYGTPWALCIPPGSNWVMPFKWRDWFHYLGLGEPVPLRNVVEARKWWHRRGQYGRIGDLQPLLDAFPHDAAC